MIRSLQSINPESKEICCCLTQWLTPAVLAVKKPRQRLMNLSSSYGLNKKILTKHVMKKKEEKKEGRGGESEEGREKRREEEDKDRKRKKC